MPRFYLLRPDGSFSDAADYPAPPAPRPEGVWTTGTPQALDAYRQLSLADRLNAAFEAHLPPDSQADLAPLKAAIKLELEQNRLTIARRIIARASIPADLEPVRAALLAQFPSPD